jgi:hypothetical protein
MSDRHKSVARNLLKRWQAERNGAQPKVRSQRLFDDKIGLSLNARIRIAAALFGKVGPFCKALGVPDEHIRQRQPSPDTVAKVVAYLDDEHYPILESAFRGARLSWEDPAADPIAECFTWFTTGHLPLCDARDLMPEATFHDESKERKDLLDEVERFLRGPTLQPIMTLVGDGMCEGLHAFAGALCERLGPQSAQRRPICYLPVSRLLVSKKPLRYDKVSYAKLVGYLAAFYRREPLADAPWPISSAAMRAELQFVRRNMAIDPCTLILDGFSTFESTLPRLAALMIDDGLASLLDELIHPYRGVDAAERPPLAFNDNRFIVLASSPVRFDSPFAVIAPPLDQPDATTMGKIARDQGRHDRMVKAAQTMAADKTDVALALVQMLITEGDDDQAARAISISTEADLAREVLCMLREHPVTLAVVTCAALMPDGVRLATLNRVLGAWREAWDEAALDQPCWNLDAALQENDRTSPKPLSQAINEAIDCLEPLLTQGQDAKILGLDTLDHARERLEFATARRREDSEFPSGDDCFDCTYLDFTAPRLRNLLIEHLIENEADHSALARLHRLLGEEMLLQYNLIVRHGDWRDSDDIRFFRRLFQAIYHGACSLALGPGKSDPGLHGLSFRALPAQNSISFVRYYAVFYRALLEAPPEWHLTRTQGRDDIKVDLLRLMMNVGSGDPWAFLSDKALLETRIPPFLTVERADIEAEAKAMGDGVGPGLNAGNVETRLTLISEQFTSLAKAALRNNELDLVDEALDASRELFRIWPDSEAFRPRRKEAQAGEASGKASKDAPPNYFAWDAKRRAQLAMARTEIDLGIVRDDQRQDRRAKAILKEFGFEEAWLKLFETPAITLRTPNFGDAVETWLESFQDQVAQKVTSDHGLSETLAAWSDLLSAVAEIDIIHAGDMAPSHPRRQTLFMRAFLYLAAGDRLRRSSFAFSPLARDFHINPHGARVLVRGLLQLIKAARYQPELDETATAEVTAQVSTPAPTIDPATVQYLVSQARRQMDMLGRLVARYPTERPSLLILDAAFARQAGTDPLADLKVAERLLAEADAQMGAAAHRPRVRLRLMRERAKVYRGIAMLTQGEEQKTYAQLAYLEIDRLYRLAHHGGLTLWESIAKRQRSKMNRLAALGRLPAADIPGLLELQGA